MNPLPLALCVFDSSKGHFGRTDIYRHTIDDLAGKFPLENFKTKVVHIKVAPGEELVFEDQKQFYQAHGFEVLRSDAMWSHFAPSHQQEYSRDLIKVYSHSSVLQCEYVLHLESDWLFDTKGDQLIDRFTEGLGLLISNPSVIGIRFPRFLNEVARLNNLFKKHGLNVSTQSLAGFIRHNDNLSLNPGLFRARDLYVATRLMKQNFSTMGQHVEHAFTHCLSFMADGALPWAIYDPAKVSVLHIGTKPGEEDVAGNVWETIP